MSIATLKKKTQTQYNNMSANRSHFSLNGTHRSQGYVGQSSLSRHLVHTPMKGNVAKGHGGCCGTYPRGNVKPSEVTSTENSHVVKSSVINTRALLDTKSLCMCSTQFRWMRVPKFVNIVKPDNNIVLNNSQQAYIDRVAKQAVKDALYVKTTECTPHNAKNTSGCKNTSDLSIESLCGSNTKSDEESKIPVSQGQYLVHLDNKCIETDIASKVRRGVLGTPFGSSK